MNRRENIRYVGPANSTLLSNILVACLFRWMILVAVVFNPISLGRFFAYKNTMPRVLSYSNPAGAGKQSLSVLDRSSTHRSGLLFPFHRGCRFAELPLSFSPFYLCSPINFLSCKIIGSLFGSVLLCVQRNIVRILTPIFLATNSWLNSLISMIFFNCSISSICH